MEFITIRIGHLNIVDHLILGISVARLNGGDHRLSGIEAVSLNAWDQICQGLKTQKLDGAFINIPLAMELFGAGLDITFLMFTHRSGSLMVQNAAKPVSSISSFKNRTIILPHTLSVQHMLLHKFLATQGLFLAPPEDTPDKNAVLVRSEAVSPCLMPEMLEYDKDGDICAMVAPDPFCSQTIERGAGQELLSLDRLWKNHPCCGFVVRTSWLRENDEFVADLVTHLFESARILDQAQANNRDNSNGKKYTIDTLLKSAEKFLDQPRKVTQTALTASRVSFTPANLVPDHSLLGTIRQYMTEVMGVMQHPVNLDNFINTAYAKKALAERTH